MADVWSVEFAVKAVFSLVNLFARIQGFSFRITLGRSLYFSTKKGLLKYFFKCKLYLKNSIKFIKKKFAAAHVKIYFVTRISGNNSIFFSWANVQISTNFTFSLVITSIYLFYFIYLLIISSINNLIALLKTLFMQPCL